MSTTRLAAANRKRDLWLRLHHYHFDHLVPSHLMDHVAEAFGGPDASSKAFASKLSRKLVWGTPFALRAIAEYKRFVYLGVVSDFFVTPPKVIDLVWHEHVLFTRGYRDFCRDVLRQEFDHAPELVATTNQTDVFQAQYDATLDLYRREFNAEPPVDIWGTPKFRPVADRQVSKDVKKRGRPSQFADDTPVYTLASSDSFDTDSRDDSRFSGGDSGGGGSSGSWAGGSDHHGSHGHGHNGGSDSGGGSDAGGGSGCSSGCGGGGCGGGD